MDSLVVLVCSGSRMKNGILYDEVWYKVKWARQANKASSKTTEAAQERVL